MSVSATPTSRIVRVDRFIVTFLVKVLIGDNWLFPVMRTCPETRGRPGFGKPPRDDLHCCQVRPWHACVLRRMPPEYRGRQESTPKSTVHRPSLLSDGRGIPPVPAGRCKMLLLPLHIPRRAPPFRRDRSLLTGYGFYPSKPILGRRLGPRSNNVKQICGEMKEKKRMSLNSQDARLSFG